MREGITFVGPSTEVLELTGNKTRAIAATREAGLPVLGSTESSDDVNTVLVAAQDMELPLFVKAVAGGGETDSHRRHRPGRGRRPRGGGDAGL